MINRRVLLRILVVVMLCVTVGLGVPQLAYAQFTTAITGVSPVPPDCVYRAAGPGSVLTLTGSGFPSPRGARRFSIASRRTRKRPFWRMS